ncbi:BTB/POZ domain-containing protein 6-like [Mytilus edulis]|uniref:BTB/POZ domain-containing protein 6-like n=1 Tax=Mytilus edulis TaxID=6550 RepID=UPI0039F02065
MASIFRDILMDDMDDPPETDWQTGKALPERLVYMLTNEVLADVKFIVGSDHTEVKAHKNIIASASPVFFAMFAGPLAEQTEVAVPDIEADIFKQMLRLINADTFSLNEENVYGLLYCADKYLIQSMKNACVRFLHSLIDLNRVWNVLQTAIDFSLDDLKLECLQYISRDTIRCLGSSQFQNLGKECFSEVIRYERLSCKEELVYESSINWAANQCRKQNIAENDENIRSVLGDVIFAIRFPLMDVEYFARNITVKNILTKDEILSVFQSIHTKAEGLFSSEKRKQTMRLLRNISHADGSVEMIQRCMDNSENLFAAADIYCKTSDINLHGVIVYVPPSRTIQTKVSLRLKRSIKQEDIDIDYLHYRPRGYQDYGDNLMNQHGGDDLSNVENFTIAQDIDTHNVPFERQYTLKRNVWYRIEATVIFKPQWGNFSNRNRIKNSMNRFSSAHTTSSETCQVENVTHGNTSIVFRHIIGRDPGQPLIHTLISGLMISEV